MIKHREVKFLVNYMKYSDVERRAKIAEFESNAPNIYQSETEGIMGLVEVLFNMVPDRLAIDLAEPILKFVDTVVACDPGFKRPQRQLISDLSDSGMLRYTMYDGVTITNEDRLAELSVQIIRQIAQLAISGEGE